MGIKNLWSLNIDETLVADKLKQYFNKKDYEVFFPLNSQLKDIDLLLVKLRSNKALSIQVKGSRTYKPTKSETLKYGDGSAAWFRLNKEAIFNPTYKIDYYIFVLHNFVDGETKKEIKMDYLIIPISQFQTVCRKKSIRKGDYYHFFIWIDSKNKRSFDFNNVVGKEIQLSKFLNNWELLK
jgi:hypothetical protein